MTELGAKLRPELLEASDEMIDDAVQYADPMTLRALFYQLTGDPAIARIEVKKVMRGYYETSAPVHEEDVALLRRKAADFLKSYRDAGAGPIDSGPPERLHESINLGLGDTIPEEDIGLYTEELALDPWTRGLEWRSAPDPERLKHFSVTIIGAGMGGLNMAAQLKHAGINFTLIEKNSGVGGTWHENRYPGARVDTPSRSYTHIFGVNFGRPNPFCAWTENEKYLNWVADNFELRDRIIVNTEVRSLTWDETDGMWEIRVQGPDGQRVMRSRAVVTSVGFLNRPNIPEIEGQAEFQGQSWHTARWPQGMDLRGKRVAVIGTGCTGYQTIPEIALEAAHVTIFQRTPQWLFGVAGYRKPFPKQVGWLDRNLPYYTNFMRARAAYNAWFWRMTTVDPEFDDPYACSASNKAARDECIAFLHSKLDDPELIATMTPEHPVWSARAVVVDPEYSVLDAIRRDHVTLVTSGIKRIGRTSIEAADGTWHDADVIVYATGFRATDYLFPMQVTGRGGKTLEALWADGGARAYLGCMMPGFPNLWSIYGPNTNGALNVAAFHEMTAFYAMQCMEKLILENQRTIEVKEEPYWRYNRMIDDLNNQRVWSDPRADNYYWSKHGRSVTQNPLTGTAMWHLLHRPDFADHRFT
jgi:4-hydroxyacetophenone monooxygenase